MQRQRNEESGAGTRPRLDGDTAVVGDDHLLDECEAETRPVRLRREERPEDAGRVASSTPGPLSVTAMRCWRCACRSCRRR